MLQNGCGATSLPQAMAVNQGSRGDFVPTIQDRRHLKVIRLLTARRRIALE
jgi:hypothetical protein